VTDTSRRSRLAAGAPYAIVVLGTAALIAYLYLPAARIDYYFDEIWRADQIRSSNPLQAYLDGPAPLPPGWVLSLGAVFELVPPQRSLVRAAAVVWAIPATVLLALAFRQLFRQVMPRTTASTVGAGVALLTMATTAFAAHAVYLNNYLADLAVAAAIIWVVVSIDTDADAEHGQSIWLAAIGIGIVAPWLGQGALFLLPGAVVILAMSRHERPSAAYVALAGSLLSSAVVAIAFIRPVSGNNDEYLDDFWSTETSDIGWWNLVRRLGETFIDSAYPPWAQHGVLLVAALATTAVGLVILQQRWRWWLPWYVSAQAVALLASFVAGWPVTFVRVNASFQVMILAAAPVAVVLGVAKIGTSVRNRRIRVAVTLTFAVVVSWAWLPRQLAANSTTMEVFARGLSDDLAVIAQQVEPTDLVAAYHFSGPYVRDRLDNYPDVPAAVTVVDEWREGPLTRARLNSLLQPETTVVWCVVPFDAGAEATDAACDLGDGWVEAERTRTTRATIIRVDRSAS
jgi:hypothetical protein